MNVQGSRPALSLRPFASTGRESDPAKWTNIFYYCVRGLPDNEWAGIWCTWGVWRVLHSVDDVSSGWTGNSDSPEAAMASLSHGEQTTH